MPSDESSFDWGTINLEDSDEHKEELKNEDPNNLANISKIKYPPDEPSLQNDSVIKMIEDEEIGKEIV